MQADEQNVAPGDPAADLDDVGRELLDRLTAHRQQRGLYRPTDHAWLCMLCAEWEMHMRCMTAWHAADEEQQPEIYEVIELGHFHVCALAKMLDLPTKRPAWIDRALFGSGDSPLELSIEFFEIEN